MKRFDAVPIIQSLSLMGAVLFFASTGFAATATYESNFTIRRDDRMWGTQIDLKTVEGEYLIRMTYDVADDLVGLPYRTASFEREDQGGTGGTGPVYRVDVTYVDEVPVTIHKEFINAKTGQVIQTVTADYLATLAGEVVDRPGALASKLYFDSLQPISAFEGSGPLLIRLKNYFVLTEYTGSNENRLLDKSYAIQNRFAFFNAISYDRNTKLVVGSSPVRFSGKKLEEGVALYSSLPGDDGFYRAFSTSAGGVTSLVEMSYNEKL